MVVFVSAWDKLRTQDTKNLMATWYAKDHQGPVAATGFGRGR